MVLKKILSVLTTAVIAAVHELTDLFSPMRGQCASEYEAITENVAWTSVNLSSAVKLSDFALDYGPNNGEAQNVCLTIGGHFVTSNVLYSCQQSNSSTLSLAYYSVPFCFGSSCTESEILQYMDETYIAAEELVLATEGYTCQTKVSNLMRIGRVGDSGIRSHNSMLLISTGTLSFLLSLPLC